MTPTLLNFLVSNCFYQSQSLTHSFEFLNVLSIRLQCISFGLQITGLKCIKPLLFITVQTLSIP